MRYRVKSPHVISETLGGETIVVNLASGHYFNLQGAAVDVWTALERGDASSSIVADLEHRYVAGDGEIREAVEKLLVQLAEAELVEPAEGDAGANGNGNGAAARPAAADVARLPFVAPSLTAYTDMQDIILLDPVHEVDPRGWPHASAGA